MANYHYREPAPPADDSYPEEVDFAEAEALLDEKDQELLAWLEEKAILRDGFDDDDIRAEEEDRNRRRRDWEDTEDVLDEMGCGRERGYEEE